MKLSENTIAVLKNFSSINTGMVLKAGKKQTTISLTNSILAEIEIDEEIPVEFGIYDLPSFISNLNYFKNGEIEIDAEKVEMKSDANFKMTFYASQASLIKVPTKKLPDFTPDVSFKLTNEQLSKAKSLASLNSLENISFIGHKGDLSIKVHNKDVKTGNNGIFSLGKYTGPAFQSIFKVEYLNMLPVDFTVDIKDNAFAKFHDETDRVVYYISMQAEA